MKHAMLGSLTKLFSGNKWHLFAWIRGRFLKNATNLIILSLLMLVLLGFDFWMIKQLKHRKFKAQALIPQKYDKLLWIGFAIILYVVTGRNVDIRYIVIYSIAIPFIDYFLVKS